jgi:hypothetical protein
MNIAMLLVRTDGLALRASRLPVASSVQQAGLVASGR